MHVSAQALLFNAQFVMLHIIHCPCPRQSSASRMQQRQALLAFEAGANLLAGNVTYAELCLQQLHDIEPEEFEYFLEPPRKGSFYFANDLSAETSTDWNKKVCGTP